MHQQPSIIQHLLPLIQNSQGNTGKSKQLILTSIKEKIYILCFAS